MELGGSPLRRRDIVGDVLVLAGDIESDPGRLAARIRQISPTLPVVYVIGNHEYYRWDWATAVDEYRQALSPLRNVHVLEKGTVVLSGIRFLGCALWTDFFGGMQGPASEGGLNDFDVIGLDGGRLRWTDVANRHRNSLAWLRKELETSFSGATVVVTHHAPSALSNPPQFAGSPISGAFYSNLDALIEETQPALWIHGHMHDSSDYRIGNTRIICNPYGYHGIETNVDWDPEAVVEI